MISIISFAIARILFNTVLVIVYIYNVSKKVMKLLGISGCS